MDTKEELEYLFYEAKEDVSRYIRYAREAEQVAKDLEVKLKKLEEKPWSPEGQGGYVLDADGGILSNACLVRHQKFGTQGTQEQMENLRNHMMHLGSEHAWARERDGVQEFIAGKLNHSVIYDYGLKCFRILFSKYNESKATIYMTKRDAKAYADMMNKGLIAFPYEEKE